MNDFFKSTDIERLLKEHGLEYEEAGYCWQDGFLLGNGNMGAVAYAPNSMEWVINKLDIYDGRVRKVKRELSHSEVMQYVKRHNIKDSWFLDDLELCGDNLSQLSVSPLILKLHLGSGELGWSAQTFPRVCQRLSVYEGELYQKAEAHFVHTDITSLIPRNTNLFVTRVSGCAVFDWAHTVEIFRPFHDDMAPPVWSGDENGEVYFEQMLPDGKNKYAVAVKIVAREPDIERVTYKLPSKFNYNERKSGISKAKCTTFSSNIHCFGDMDIFVCVRSSHECENPLPEAIKELNNGIERGFESLEAENRKWWAEYWDKSAADFGTYTEIQKYWNLSMYELACSFGKAPMPALNGLCCGPVSPTISGVSSPFYTHDQNAQMPSMPLLVLNHTELTEALVDTYYNVRDVLKQNAERLFGNPGGNGIFIPLTMTQDGLGNPGGAYRYTLCGNAYTGLVLSLIWRFTKNTELVREKIYPLLCELISFYTDNIFSLGDDGKYHMDLSVPPEIFTFTRDDSATMSMLETCLKTALEMSEALGIDNSKAAKWKDVLEHYPQISKRRDGGWWPGPDIPENHFCFGGHLLYPFFPSEAYISDEDKKTTEKTLEFIRKNAIERSFADTDGRFHYLHDWSWCLTSMAQLRIRQQNFFGELHRALELFAKPNGLFSHDSIVISECDTTEDNYKYSLKSDGYSADPGRSLWWYDLGRCASPSKRAKRTAAPVLEGNSIFLLCAAETLLQSYDGIIRLFPGVPDSFTGKFRRFLAQGGFEVSAAAEKGAVKYVLIKSLSGGQMNLYNPKKDNGDIRGLKKMTRDGKVIFSKNMKKDEIIELVF